MHLHPAPSPHKYHHIPTQTSFTDTLSYPDCHQIRLSTNQELPHAVNPQDRSVTRAPDDFPNTRTFPGAHTGPPTATPLSINLDYRLMFTRSPDVPLSTSRTYLSSSDTSPSPSLEHPQGSSSRLPATTRSFPSSVAVPVAPFELQPAPSMLQHKPSYTKTYPKTYSDPGLTPTPHGLQVMEKDKCL
ncbi:hypothetical protein F5879DRAFT_1006168 [Lentinula edodes]|nr:hypothetical protein F5879DRAFT_1006168 [Lentinula edodes]